MFFGEIGGKRAIYLLVGTYFLASDARAEEIVLESAMSQTSDSVSCGSTNRGALGFAVSLPTEGFGFVMADPWRSRGSRFGTSELVSLIQRSSAQVAMHHPGSQLSVADMSKKHGGPIAAHVSHQNGRDADLIYYAMDAEGNPFYPDSHMAYYTVTGRAFYAKAPRFVKNIPVRYFDLKRNWSLVRAMLLDPYTEVERIFVSPRVENWLLIYAAEIGEKPALLRTAKRILHAPKDVKGHNDHMHVRIACSAEDVRQGRCRNLSSQRPKNGRRWNRRMQCPQPEEPDTVSNAKVENNQR